MAAQRLLDGGRRVELYDAMPSLGRKFLLAGKGGLNLTHSEPFDEFTARYGDTQEFWRPRLRTFGPQQVRDWAAGLGIDSFVGSSGRVFPTGMKAAPLLRAWLQRMRALGLRIHTRHRLVGLTAKSRDAKANKCLQFETPRGPLDIESATVVLALGGASWPQLGSDGAWVPWLGRCGVAIAPLRPANCGFDVARADVSGAVSAGWSEHLRNRFVGLPLKGLKICWTAVDGAPRDRIGECVITEGGIEGSLIYAAARDLRDAIERDGHAVLRLDLMPQRDVAFIRDVLTKPRGSRSLSSVLKARLGLDALRISLLHELLGRAQLADPPALAAAIKALPLNLAAARPVAEAISTAGGVTLAAVDDRLALTAVPGVYCAGEMLDWEAPTGGYLLTACFASGVAAAEGILSCG